MSYAEINKIFRERLDINPELYITIPDHPDGINMPMNDGSKLTFSRFFYDFLDKENIFVLTPQLHVVQDYPIKGMGLGYMHSTILGKLRSGQGGCAFEQTNVVLPFKYTYDKESDDSLEKQLNSQLIQTAMREGVSPWGKKASLQFSKTTINYKYMFLHPDMLSDTYLSELGFQR